MDTNLKTYIITILFGFSCVLAKAQPISLNNPSFEDRPQPGKAPYGWQSCTGEHSPPDVEPCKNFEVTEDAVDGDTYLGLVTRDDGSSEGVSQYLAIEQLQEDSTYEISMFLFCSTQKRSSTARNAAYRLPVKASFHAPTRLRIWGGHDACDYKTLLFESELISNKDWKRYIFTFQSDDDYEYISFEATFEKQFEYYNGNLMIDKVELRKK